MRIIIFSETSAASIAANLGKSEYSYYFILKSYLPALQRLGDLVYVKDPANEVDVLYDESCTRGESAVFLSFSPPHKTQVDLRCPTVCILAWEFSSVPDEDLGGGNQDNWVEAISAIGNIITISEYSSAVIRGQIDAKLNLATIPAPVTRKIEATRPSGRPELLLKVDSREQKRLRVSAEVTDTRDLEITDDIVFASGAGNCGIGGRDLAEWDGTALELNFDGLTKTNSGCQFLTGFHPPEDWGAWARSDRPWINLPFKAHGDFELEIELIGFGDNVGRCIDITIGNQCVAVSLETKLRRYRLKFHDVQRGSAIVFSKLCIGYTSGADLLRALSIGVGSLALHRRFDDAGQNELAATPRSGVLKAAKNRPSAKPKVNLVLSGLVYTAIFNPEDGRKNWEDILTAFCWAFRDDPNKTLILKLSCPTMTATWGRLLRLFSQLNPFACRIIVLHGFLETQEMQQLMQVTDYIVNASHAEGQCLPLLEFMAEGIPAIAPNHTAMASYINEENALIVKSSRDATCWPQDERQVKRTFFYRIDWESLLDCFLRSAQIAETDASTYRDMAFHAASTVRGKFSYQQADKLLAEYLQNFNFDNKQV